jgi:hypothetical protein
VIDSKSNVVDVDSDYVQVLESSDGNKRKLSIDPPDKPTRTYQKNSRYEDIRSSSEVMKDLVDVRTSALVDSMM